MRTFDYINFFYMERQSGHRRPVHIAKFGSLDSRPIAKLQRHIDACHKGIEDIKCNACKELRSQL